jgi:hypothetical protein
MCGGWRQDKPKPYQLVLIRELSPDHTIDMVHVGFWGNVVWCALSTEWYDGTKFKPGTFKGISITNIYGWKELKTALD